MTKKALVKMIIDLEYTQEQQKTAGLVAGRTRDLMRYNKAFLEERVKHLSK